MTPSDALLRTLAAVSPASRILDLACRDGHHTLALTALGFDVWACDPNSESVAAVRRQLDEALGDGEGQRRVAQSSPDALGYPDGYVDWVVASGLAGSDVEIVSALVEARRVLKPGGWLWIELVDLKSLEALTELAEAAGLLVAEAPARADERGTVFGTYRRVEPGVAA
ncbi:MAG: hypothetical protein Rubg2KO_04460 [Rubricoccaceae bacterium]